jgi:glycosyltransferase involved in cell wall biosynthesis
MVCGISVRLRSVGYLLAIPMSVSVTIATYNRSAMVRQAIECALQQTRPPDEIVVSDDASTDDTWRVLEGLARQDARLRIFRRRRNSGGVENWNCAIQRSRGDYIAWCSDDDRYLPDHLEASIRYLDQHPEAGLVHAGFVDAIETVEGIRMEPRRIRCQRPKAANARSLPAYMSRYYDWPFHPSTIVMRRTVWEAAGPFDARWSLADTEWFVRAAERFNVVLLPRPGVINRRHAGNWSNRVGSAAMQREIFLIVEGAIGRLGARGIINASAWRTLWRANVRLRLLLTLLQRLKTGHSAAACAAWKTLALETGRRAPDCLVRLGEETLLWLCARRPASFESARQSVSPL